MSAEAATHHSEVDMIEEEEKLVSSKKQTKKKNEDGGDESGEDEDEANESDYNSDIDGVHKSAKEMQGYDDVDGGGEEAQDEEEQGGKGRSDSQEEGVEGEDANVQHHNIHKESSPSMLPYSRVLRLRATNRSRWN